jgi:hypothetical protein
MTVKIIPEYFPDKPGEFKVRCRLSEGTLTVAMREGARGKQRDYSFASGCAGPYEDDNGVYPGDKVVIVGVDSEGYLVVAKRAYTDQQPIGEIVSKIDFVGMIPDVGTYTAGNYTQREATVFIYGTRIRQLPVYLAQSDNLAAGNFLKPCAVNNYANYFSESATLTSRMALQSVTASSSAASTAKIAVLEGFESGTTVDAVE